MAELKHILAATDLSGPARHAVERAALVAAGSDAALAMIHIANLAPLDQVRQLLSSEPERLEQDLVDQLRDALRTLAATIHERFGVTPALRVATGDLLPELLNHAATLPADLLVCTAAATGGFLVWNYPRGVLFAGDGGAYVWGVVIALASISLVQRNAEVSPWFPLLLLIYPVWETLFSIYRKLARGVSPGMADALHFHQLIYRRIVRSVFPGDDAARRMLMRNNRTSPYLWGFTLLTVVPAVLFWRSTPWLMAFCALFGVTYVVAYLTIVRFKVPGWVKR